MIPTNVRGMVDLPAPTPGRVVSTTFDGPCVVCCGYAVVDDVRGPCTRRYVARSRRVWWFLWLRSTPRWEVES